MIELFCENNSKNVEKMPKNINTFPFSPNVLFLCCFFKDTLKAFDDFRNKQRKCMNVF